MTAFAQNTVGLTCPILIMTGRTRFTPDLSLPRLVLPSGTMCTLHEVVCWTGYQEFSRLALLAVRDVDLVLSWRAECTVGHGGLCPHAEFAADSVSEGVANMGIVLSTVVVNAVVAILQGGTCCDVCTAVGVWVCRGVSVWVYWYGCR